MASAVQLVQGTPRPPTGISPAFSGEHAWCNEKMMRASDLPDGVPLPAFFADGGFAAAIDRYRDVCGGDDRRAIASMWSLYYFAALAIPYLLARRIAGQSLPISFSQVSIALQDNGLPQAFGLTDDGRFHHADPVDDFMQLRPLLDEHLGEAIGHIKSSGISAKLCWNNAAVYVDYAIRLTSSPDRGEAGIRDLPLFTRGCLPDGGVNPFCGCLRHVEEDGETVKRRKLCCLRYLLPGVPSCGGLCALPGQRKQ